MKPLAAFAEITVRRCRWWLLAALLIIHTISFYLTVQHKRFWYDEIFTLAIARLHGWSGIMRALTAGVDLNPPLPYFLTQLALHLPGPPETTARLPQFLGVATLILCLYLFLSYRLSPEASLLGAATPVLSHFWLYSAEARPYGLVLGAIGLVLVCWQRIHRSPWFGIGLALALSLATASHYYGVLIPLCLGLAELYPLFLRRHFRWPVWLALLASALPLIVILPFRPTLFEYRRLFEHSHWTTPLISYQHPGLTIAIALALIGAAFLSPHLESQPDPTPGLPAEEIALAGLLAAIPLLGITLSALSGVNFSERYGVGTIAGLSLLLAYAAAALPRRGFVALILPTWLIMGFYYASTSWQSVSPINSAGSWMAEEAPAVRRTAHRYPDMPIIISGNWGYLAAALYWPHDLRQRAIYITDPDSRLKWQYEGASEIAMTRIATIMPGLHIVTLPDFLAQHRPALILRQPLDWISLELLDRGYQLETISGKNAFDLSTIEIARPPQ